MNENRESASILFAADEAITSQVVKVQLANAGWIFDTAIDLEGAARCTVQRSYDLVITTSRLRSGSALDLLRLVREKNPDQAVIVITGCGQVGEMLEFLHEGASDIVEQPIDPGLLEKSVRRLLSAVRQKGLDQGIYRYALCENTTFQFTSVQLNETRVPFVTADRLFRAGKLPLREKLRLDLAFQEALTNSLEHGNLELESVWKETINAEGLDRYTQVKQERLQDPRYASRIVKVSMSYDGRRITAVFDDQGRGFKIEKTAGPDEILHVHGRGLSILEATMDEVRYENGGTRMVMSKNLSFP